MKNSLDFVVIGAQKCATTWLYDCLKDNPSLNLRNSKNEDTYYGGELFNEKGSKWYFSQFESKDEEMPKGCISVEYIEDEKAPQLLQSLNPDIKIIASLRQPTERALSAYQWYVRKAYIPDLPLQEGMEQVIKHFNGEIENAYTPAYKNIIERGFYAGRLKNWYNVFSPAQIKVNFFDEVKEDSLKAIQEVMLFLGLDASFVPPNLHTVPKKNTGSAPLIKLQRRFPTSRIVGKIVDVSNQLLFRYKKTASPAQISPEIRKQLDEIYKPSLVELDKLFGQYNPSIKKTLHNFWG